MMLQVVASLTIIIQMILEVSFMLLENIYSTGVTYNPHLQSSKYFYSTGITHDRKKFYYIDPRLMSFNLLLPDVGVRLPADLADGVAGRERAGVDGLVDHLRRAAAAPGPKARPHQEQGPEVPR
jgi:hypothetical protein